MRGPWTDGPAAPSHRLAGYRRPVGDRHAAAMAAAHAREFPAHQTVPDPGFGSCVILAGAPGRTGNRNQGGDLMAQSGDDGTASAVYGSPRSMGAHPADT